MRPRPGTLGSDAASSARDRSLPLAGHTGTLRLGVFGSPGSFSEEAALVWAEREGLTVEVAVHRREADALFRDLAAGSFDLGVLPVANSVGGLVRASFEAMGRHDFHPLGQVSLPIRHCLLAHEGAVLESVTEVASHPQALVQCERFLRATLPGVALREATDTASAARDLAQGSPATTGAVLASRRAAERFGLTVLAADVQDEQDNRTVFVVFGPPRAQEGTR